MVDSVHQAKYVSISYSRSVANVAGEVEVLMAVVVEL